ncbi:hypothetical protein AMAG_18350 [Allomyces macrogynus ATCC 38327]|uniref:Uncharacterized protein n=1 Tax=Allomyces macrogynus (strain ATCC 38327) TaxID=578462 RepID=A0A0L0S5V0_ALLM3|nr:hypothetical protein AMAG_18350 [Allomyces macrogynus ATCC 38327]|eukprot:KNE57830.1 hypothetical protein AMAG_18350 [Allomyces macrogynus ATCC 38327]
MSSPSHRWSTFAEECDHALNTLDAVLFDPSEYHGDEPTGWPSASAGRTASHETVAVHALDEVLNPAPRPHRSSHYDGDSLRISTRGHGRQSRSGNGSGPELASQPNPQPYSQPIPQPCSQHSHSHSRHSRESTGALSRSRHDAPPPPPPAFRDSRQRCLSSATSSWHPPDSPGVFRVSHAHAPAPPPASAHADSRSDRNAAENVPPSFHAYPTSSRSPPTRRSNAARGPPLSRSAFANANAPLVSPLARMDIVRIRDPTVLLDRTVTESETAVFERLSDQVTRKYLAKP